MRATPVPQKKKKLTQKKTARVAGNPRTAKKKKSSYVDTKKKRGVGAQAQ